MPTKTILVTSLARLETTEAPSTKPPKSVL